MKTKILYFATEKDDILDSIYIKYLKSTALEVVYHAL
jgi:hypothetical protein